MVCRSGRNPTPFPGILGSALVLGREGFFEAIAENKAKAKAAPGSKGRPQILLGEGVSGIIVVDVEGLALGWVHFNPAAGGCQPISLEQYAYVCLCPSQVNAAAPGIHSTTFMLVNKDMLVLFIGIRLIIASRGRDLEV